MSNPTTTKPRAKRPAKVASAPMELMPKVQKDFQIELPQPVSIGPMRMLEMAVNRGASVEELDRLLQLVERHEANEARKAFVAAMVQFKRNAPTITKDKTAQMYKDGKPTYTYSYADLASVSDKLIAALAAVDISHDWTTSQNGSQITVACTITHALGHGKTTALTAGADTSGGKNSIQAIGSAVSYLERYTLLAVCGIAVAGGDNDGAGDGYQMTDEDRQSVRGNGRNHKPADVAAGKQRPGQQGAPDDQLLADARAAADQGPAVFGPYWRALTDIQRKALSAELPDLQQRAGRKGAN